jgi:hypothetical protein
VFVPAPEQTSSAIVSTLLEEAKMSPPARRYYESVFLPRYKEVQEQIEATPLAILVWGPGNEPGDPYKDAIHKKRLDIRDALLAQGYAAVFSEDVDRDSPSKLESIKAREIAQSMVADFIVAVIGSPGSVAEIHDFAGFIVDIGSKMLVFVDSRFAEGYSYRGALTELNSVYGNVSTFKYPEDITDCHLLGAVYKRLRTLRLAKWRTQLK